MILVGGVHSVEGGETDEVCVIVGADSSVRGVLDARGRRNINTAADTLYLGLLLRATGEDTNGACTESGEEGCLSVIIPVDVALSACRANGADNRLGHGEGGKSDLGSDESGGDGEESRTHFESVGLERRKVVVGESEGGIIR